MKPQIETRHTKIVNGHTINCASLQVYRPDERPKKVLNAQIVSKVGHKMQDTTTKGSK